MPATARAEHDEARALLKQAAHASVRDGQWLIGMGMAAAVRGAPMSKAGARARPDRTGTVTIETDMTDIGAGSYTIVVRGCLTSTPVCRLVVCARFLALFSPK
ncbi:molybdopterin cofactor-binding domain-containing protein [Xanthomonas euroxanthea]|uniref:molybdopterin cofactor-binding domain-containing protein n=1 Tax=Xanthomonas euroxanthea TaxID=2259622 RepID=UPI001F218167|nr:molybdopterin cofactor-binding domain-containing protein [Xanthomonas euroxanthea]